MAKQRNRINDKQKNKTSISKSDYVFLFSKQNYTLMIVGLLIIAIGFILMFGGSSTDPKVFNEAIYNTRRIRIAPTLVILGFIVEIFAILHKPKQ